MKGQGTDKLKMGEFTLQIYDFLSRPKVKSTAHAGDKPAIFQINRVTDGRAQIGAQNVEKIGFALPVKAQLFRSAAGKTAGVRGIVGDIDEHGTASLSCEIMFDGFILS